MDARKKQLLQEEGGKYCLDVSKIVFGGIILAGIMKQKIENYAALFVLGGIVFVILSTAGFLLLSRSNAKKK